MSKKNREMYTKLILKTTDEERKRIEEPLQRNKKRSIELFLKDVNNKKGTFLNQKKK